MGFFAVEMIDILKRASGAPLGSLTRLASATAKTRRLFARSRNPRSAKIGVSVSLAHTSDGVSAALAAARGLLFSSWMPSVLPAPVDPPAAGLAARSAQTPNLFLLDKSLHSKRQRVSRFPTPAPPDFTHGTVKTGRSGSRHTLKPCPLSCAFSRETSLMDGVRRLFTSVAGLLRPPPPRPPNPPSNPHTHQGVSILGGRDRGIRAPASRPPAQVLRPARSAAPAPSSPLRQSSINSLCLRSQSIIIT